MYITWFGSVNIRKGETSCKKLYTGLFAEFVDSFGMKRHFKPARQLIFILFSNDLFSRGFGQFTDFRQEHQQVFSFSLDFSILKIIASVQLTLLFFIVFL